MTFAEPLRASRRRGETAAILGIGQLCALFSLGAQSSLAGRVLSDSVRAPISNAEVVILRLGRSAITDSAGRYTLHGLEAGTYQVITRALGYQPDSSLVDIGPNESMSRDVHLRPAAIALERVRVETEGVAPSAKISIFEERRKRSPGGKFLDAKEIQKWEGRRTGDMFATIPGVDLHRAGMKSYATGSRAIPPLTPSSRGEPCYMDVYLDGALIYSKAAAGAQPFDLNSIPASHLAAVEVYSSAANIPPELNRTSKGCGVIALWTK